MLKEDRDALINFCLGVQHATKEDDPDGEFPPGHEPDSEERSEEVGLHGIGNGFGITQP